MNEPLKVALEDTLTVDCVGRKNSVQAGLCGGGLMPTVEDLHEIFTNLSNLVAVEINTGHAVAVTNNLSICEAEVLRVGDCSVHQTFDLTHDTESDVGVGFVSSPR